jgi:hypothetical protein
MKNKIFCGNNNGRLGIADWKRCLKTINPDVSYHFVRWIIVFLTLALFVLPYSVNLLAEETEKGKPAVAFLDDISFGGHLSNTQAKFIIQGVLKACCHQKKSHH